MEMGQMMTCLLAEIRTNQAETDSNEAETNANLRKMREEMKAGPQQLVNC
jgi:hypothetical protein